MRALVRTILPGGLEGLPFDSMNDDVRQSAVWQAFELRGGVFYEPSVACSTQPALPMTSLWA
ncbi:hypothetical protein BCO18175_00994 [Burkholderia contaminans]|uniref:hypothetical protein n=1 Tax=Burkholderia contaminans TaxID=488447 RepID=UPI00064ACEEE|nr:hypothetical protein [Burkholderia contaminans]AKM45557.1 hypothetical protein NL30_37850 [Burkholderia contaminans]VWC60769.1 hypothetical protein BCO18175_00994 [Burkholderia contaminans]